jgi:hypothetical protein
MGDWECSQTHCEKGACQPGGTGHLCTRDADCEDKRCSDKGTCMFGGSGPSCTQDSDCARKQCVFLGGGAVCLPGEHGQNWYCQSDADCKLPNQDQKTCQPVAFGDTPGMVCVVGGSTFTKCSQDSDCRPNKICKSGSCILSTDSGTPCSDDADCQQKMCDVIAGTCSPPSGFGFGGSCEVDEDCLHRICIKGFGQNECAAGVGPGISECTQNTDCPRQPPLAAAPDPASLRRVARQVEGLLRRHLGGRQSFGDADGKVDLVFVQDLTCGMCRQTWRHKLRPFLAAQARKSGVRVRFLEFPIGFFRREAKLAEAALCARDQGKYLAFVDQIYALGSTASADRPEAYAGLLGLDAQRFAACVTSGRYAKQVRKDYELGASLGVQGTPTLFIDGHRYVGYQENLDLAELIRDRHSRRPRG